MAVKNTSDRYGWLAKWLHWSIAIGIIGMIIMGFYLHSFTGHQRYLLIQLHKSFGVLILFLMVIRLIWRWINITPRLPQHIPVWQQYIARATHYALYAGAIIMPFSGWAMTTAAGYMVNWFFLFKIPLPFIPKNSSLSHIFWQTHSITAFVLSVLIVIHTLAALKHHFINKDHILQRMLPGKKFISKKRSFQTTEKQKKE